MSTLHVTPRPETVAAIIDGYGRDAARERWGWLCPNVVARLAVEGRSIRGSVPPRGRTSMLGGGHNLLALDWDGPESRAARLKPSIAAAALGRSAASLSRSE